MTVYANGKDLKELLDSITWSGDAGQIARKLEFGLIKNVRDKNLPAVTISEGDRVYLIDDAGKTLFFGIVFDIDRSASAQTVKYLAYDLMWYVNKSSYTGDYRGTPEAIAGRVCGELGIAAGSLAVTGVQIHNPCVNKTAYQIIQSSYTAAARKNGKKYMQCIKDGDKLSVIEKGTDSGVVLTADANLSDADYKVSLQSLVNRVVITDKKGRTVKVVEDAASRAKYGTVQQILEQGDKEDKTAEAQHALCGPKPSASVKGLPDDTRAVAGYSVLVEEADTGLVGSFFISGDTHSYSNGKTEMSLTLEFENLMDEVEIDKDKDKKGKS